MEPCTIAGSYREFAPHPALREYVRALFAFGPAPAPAGRRVTFEVLLDGAERSPTFAHGSASIVIELTSMCDAHGRWRRGTGGAHGLLIGPMSRAAVEPVRDLPAMIGAYLHPAETWRFTRLPADELTDRVVPLGELWGPIALELESQIGELEGSAAVDHLESALLRRANRQSDNAASMLNIVGLAAFVLERGGCVTVKDLALAGGVSRQHLGRVFRESVGVAPKLFCRLARFQAALAYAKPASVSWARAAAALGYADQSHMIAEMKEFSGCTPERLAGGRVFHPFVAHTQVRPGSA